MRGNKTELLIFVTPKILKQETYRMQPSPVIYRK
jgi:hypothetical protein